jgi:hypothetical protein
VTVWERQARRQGWIPAFAGMTGAPTRGAGILRVGQTLVHEWIPAPRFRGGRLFAGMTGRLQGSVTPTQAGVYLSQTM